VKKIITLPNNSLRQRSKKVPIVSDQVLMLIDEMENATLKWEDSRQHEVGVALAAVQVNELARVIIVRNNFDDKEDRSFSAFINPEIMKFEGEIIEDFEGCLSIKDVYGKVPRYSKVRVKALDRNGKPIRVTAKGFLARIFQHEVDHTNGIMFIDHIKDNPEAFFHLDNKGHLEPVDYDKFVKNSKTLWG
jgi:peptide deformylase